MWFQWDILPAVPNCPIVFPIFSKSSPEFPYDLPHDFPKAPPYIAVAALAFHALLSGSRGARRPVLVDSWDVHPRPIPKWPQLFRGKIG